MRLDCNYTYLHPLQEILPIQHTLLQWVLAFLTIEEELQKGFIFGRLCIYVLIIVSTLRGQIKDATLSLSKINHSLALTHPLTVL